MKSVPRWLNLDSIYSVVQPQQVYFSEPLKMQNFDRICWIRCQTQNDYESLLAKPLTVPQGRDSISLHCVKSSLSQKGPKAMSPLLPGSEDRDFRLAIRCCEVLDQEFNTQVNLTGLPTNREKLQFLVRYMWKVFGYAFYSGVRAEDERSISIKCYYYSRANSTANELSPEVQEFEEKYLTFAKQLIHQGP